MSILGMNGSEFHGLTRQILGSGHRMRFKACGGSMQPFIQDGDILHVAPLDGKRIKRGDVLLVEVDEGRLLAHRVVKTGRHNGICTYLIQSDICNSPDGWFELKNVLGYVVIVEHGNQRIKLTSITQQWKARIWVMISPWNQKFYWLPKWFRYHVRYLLFGGMGE